MFNFVQYATSKILACKLLSCYLVNECAGVRFSSRFEHLILKNLVAWILMRRVRQDHDADFLLNLVDEPCVECARTAKSLTWLFEWIYGNWNSISAEWTFLDNFQPKTYISETYNKDCLEPSYYFLSFLGKIIYQLIDLWRLFFRIFLKS